MTIRRDDLTGTDIIALLRQHVKCMEEVSPPASRHVLGLDGMQKPEITFRAIWNGADLAGCGTLKEINARHAEIKSMRIAGSPLRKGIASMMLVHLIEEARRRDYHRLSLETGAMAYFEPLRKLDAQFNFVRCGPLGSYREDPHSVFLTLKLEPDL